VTYRRAWRLFERGLPDCLAGEESCGFLTKINSQHNSTGNNQMKITIANMIVRSLSFVSSCMNSAIASHNAKSLKKKVEDRQNHFGYKDEDR